MCDHFFQKKILAPLSKRKRWIVEGSEERGVPQGDVLGPFQLSEITALS